VLMNMPSALPRSTTLVSPVTSAGGAHKGGQGFSSAACRGAGSCRARSAPGLRFDRRGGGIGPSGARGPAITSLTSRPAWPSTGSSRRRSARTRARRLGHQLERGDPSRGRGRCRADRCAGAENPRRSAPQFYGRFRRDLRGRSALGRCRLAVDERPEPDTLHGTAHEDARARCVTWPQRCRSFPGRLRNGERSNQPRRGRHARDA
jgi:hypothetical protein